MTRPTAAATTFSIVMPAFNAEETIRPAIDSVLRQTRSDFELIVVDDGSTDETIRIVDELARDGRVRLIRQPNLGPSAARNTAIAEATGAYVSLLDSDDLWLPNYLAEMGSILDRDPEAAVAFTHAWVFDHRSGRIRRSRRVDAVRPPVPPADATPGQFFLALLDVNFVFVGATIRRRVFEDVGLFRVDVRGNEDYEMWLRLAAHGYVFRRHAEALAMYREKPGQLSSDRRSMAAGAHRVYEIVSTEYELEDELREAAERRMHEQAELVARLGDRRGTSRQPGRLRRAGSILWNYYVTPPAELASIRDLLPRRPRTC
jgi:glycosyltransferase involved in cell wall biosynthesis